MQVFYEIKGGTAHFGTGSSRYHGHETERTYGRGLYEEWNENHLVHLIGHSFEGVTFHALYAIQLMGTGF